MYMLNTCFEVIKMALNIRRPDAVKVTYIGLFTAIVIVLQYLGGFIKLGPFSVSLVLVPIVVGSAICGPFSGAWLGGVFSAMVFVTGDAALFLSINILGTIITVILKGVLAGLAAGYAYKLLENINRYLATFAAAVICPVVNTGIFLLGCRLFFFDTVKEWAIGEGMSVGLYMIIGLVGFNFLFELIFNLVLAPVCVRIIGIDKMSNKS